MKKAKIPRLTISQMEEVERLMVEEYGFQPLQMTEHAGKCLACLAVSRFLDKKPRQKQIFVLAGPGPNGGGALVAARWLHNWGAKVCVYLTEPSPEAMSESTQQQLRILEKMGVKIKSAGEAKHAKPVKLVIDGILCPKSPGSPTGAARSLIEWASKQIAPVLSLEIPSGLDLGTGKIYKPAIRADATLTLALPKRGLFYKNAKEQRGELYLADIGVPPQLYAEPSLNIKVSKKLFAKCELTRID